MPAAQRPLDVRLCAEVDGCSFDSVQTRLEVDRDDEGIHFRETIQREGENATVAKTVDTEVAFLVPNPYLANIIGQAYRGNGSRYPPDGQGDGRNGTKS